MTKRILGVTFHYDDRSTVSYLDDRKGDGNFLRLTSDASDAIVDRTPVLVSVAKAQFTRSINKLLRED